MVVMSPSSSTPWNPATTGTMPDAMVSLSRCGLDGGDARAPMDVRGAHADLAAGERTRRNAAFAQRHREQRDRTCSPVASNTSISRGFGSRAMPAARSTSRSVESPMAETTTAMRSPRSRTAATLPATRWMSSTEPTDVPPYFWTMVREALTPRAWRERSSRRSAERQPSAAGLLPPACAKSGRPPPLPPTCPATLPTSSPALTLRDLVRGDARDERDLVRGVDRRQHDDGRLQFVLELVHRVAQRARVGAIDLRGDSFTPAMSRAPAERSVPCPLASLFLSARFSFSSWRMRSSASAHLGLHVIARAAHETRDFLHELIGVLDVFERAFGRDGFDAPHARGHAAFAHDLEHADVARARDVRAAAELHREIAHAQHAHVFLVFLAEQRDRAFRHRRVVGHLAGFRGRVPADFGVHEPLDLLQLIGGDRLEVREVEAQPIGRDQRAFLLDVRARAPCAAPHAKDEWPSGWP